MMTGPKPEDGDRHGLASYVQDRPACLRFLRAARGKSIPSPPQGELPAVAAPQGTGTRSASSVNQLAT